MSACSAIGQYLPRVGQERAHAKTDWWTHALQQQIYIFGAIFATDKSRVEQRHDVGVLPDASHDLGLSLGSIQRLAVGTHHFFQRVLSVFNVGVDTRVDKREASLAEPLSLSHGVFAHFDGRQTTAASTAKISHENRGAAENDAQKNTGVKDITVVSVLF